MASLTEFPWRTMAPKVRQYKQFLGEQLRDTAPLVHTRVSILAAVGMGVGGFCLGVLLWWLTASPRVPASPTTLTSIELQQLLSTLQSIVTHPTLGAPSPGTAAPVTLKEVTVDVHFVVQHSVLPGGAPLYRLVPVDTALQTRPDNVQTLRIRLAAPAPPPTTVGTPGAVPLVPPTAEEDGLHKPAPPKKRGRP